MQITGNSLLLGWMLGLRMCIILLCSINNIYITKLLHVLKHNKNEIKLEKNIKHLSFYLVYNC